MLVRMPDGNWLRAADVAGVVVLPMHGGDDRRCGVVIYCDDSPFGRPKFPFDNRSEAEAVRDRFAEAVNRTLSGIPAAAVVNDDEFRRACAAVDRAVRDQPAVFGYLVQTVRAGCGLKAVAAEAAVKTVLAAVAELGWYAEPVAEGG